MQPSFLEKVWLLLCFLEALMNFVLLYFLNWNESNLAYNDFKIIFQNQNNHSLQWYLLKFMLWSLNNNKEALGHKEALTP